MSSRLFKLIVFPFLGTLFIAAQTPPPQNLTQGPVFRTGPRDVIADIVATDRDGHAINNPRG